jgi:predicted transcriptional regulator of viral defense system
VVCLISALTFYGITTEIPYGVFVALPQSVKRPRLTYPPQRVFWFSGAALTSGVERHKIDGVPVNIFGPEKKE